MAEVICEVCGRKIDSRGLSGHMKTHVSKENDSDGQNSGIISYPSGDKTTGATGDSYPSNESETDVKQDVVPGNTETPNNVKQPKKKKAANSGASHAGHPPKAGVKTVASKPASKPASSPDTRGQLKTEAEHKEEWQGLFRE